MTESGEIFFSPVPGERSVTLVGSRDSGHRLFVGHLTLKPHPAMNETFTMLARTKPDWWNVGNFQAQLLVKVRPPVRFRAMGSELLEKAQSGQTNAQGPPPLAERLVEAVNKYRNVIVLTNAAPPA